MGMQICHLECLKFRTIEMNVHLPTLLGHQLNAMRKLWSECKRLVVQQHVIARHDVSILMSLEIVFLQTERVINHDCS